MILTDSEGKKFIHLPGLMIPALTLALAIEIKDNLVRDIEAALSSDGYWSPYLKGYPHE